MNANHVLVEGQLCEKVKPNKFACSPTSMDREKTFDTVARGFFGKCWRSME